MSILLVSLIATNMCYAIIQYFLVFDCKKRKKPSSTAFSKTLFKQSFKTNTIFGISTEVIDKVENYKW